MLIFNKRILKNIDYTYMYLRLTFTILNPLLQEPVEQCCYCEIKMIFLLLCLLPLVLCEYQYETTTVPPPPHPYAFGYAAGRYPGHIDRYHSEVSDGAGTIQGSYSYVDPSFKIRTVEYIADKNGFRTANDPSPLDTKVVAEAKQRHLEKFNQIAQQQASNQILVPGDTVAVHKAKLKHLELFERIAQEHARLAAIKQP